MRPSPILIEASDDYPVHNLNTGLNYTTIQEAMDANETWDGHIILVDEGIYYEHVFINKSVLLIGENPQNTTIDVSDPSGYVVTIYADGVNVTGFTIRGGYTGIRLEGASHCNIFGNNITANTFGMEAIYSSSNNSVYGNNITNNSWGIRIYDYSNLNKISGNNITNNDNGIILEQFSDNNIIIGNCVKDNSAYGIYLTHSSHDTISENAITNNSGGLLLIPSYNSTLSGNVMENNIYNLNIWGSELSQYMHSIDTSNLVNEKPVYYLVNQKDLLINPTTYPEIGYLAFIQCDNITVEDLTLENNAQGLLVIHTNNSRIINNTLRENYYSLWLEQSCDNLISGNNITDKQGAYFYSCSNNTISRNNVTSEYDGFLLSLFSNGNTVTENSMIGNNNGIWLGLASNNRFYHNNFIGNKRQVFIYVSGHTNFWDNEIEGNYWSDYNGTDSDSDGIGDTEYAIDENNTDHCPLMGMFSSFNTSYGYVVDFVSNSSISDVSFNLNPIEAYPPEAILAFNTSGETGTEGFLRVCIPKILINGSYVIRFDNEMITNTTYPQVRELPCSNETHLYFYINYTHSEHRIEISGVTTIPEFPSFLILPVFMIATLLAVIIYRRKQSF